MKLINVFLLILSLIVPGFYDGLNVATYDLTEGAGQSDVRIALITDLHCCLYGEGQRELLAAIDAQRPDLVLLGGDIFASKQPIENVEALLAGLQGRYPCYFVTGNHEYSGGKKARARRKALLKQYGVFILDGAYNVLNINGRRVNLCGVADPAAWRSDGQKDMARRYEAQLADLASLNWSEGTTILLAHRPEYFDLYREYGYRLILSGHTHGGQWRIPGVVNGVFVPDQGLLPAYAGGMYAVDGATMIVSRGLSREVDRLPRYYNRPELVIVIV